ncbi:fructose-bisphosphate aldolase class II [Candidatus Micrarchaeota archaeon]|nr:fructose-bisphosphate aldolase class II [Candidatus Micrarchaeota archaeon]
MPLVPMKQILDEAAKKSYGVPHFNVNNMEQAQAIMRSASEVESPVIMAASRGALKYTDLIFIKHLMMACIEKYPKIPVAMHLDHGNGLESVKTAISLGFTSVMMDGSLKEDAKTPTTFDENVKVTKSCVDYAHKVGVTVEGELGTLGGIEDGVGSGQVHLTDPNQVKEFLQKTGVDALAVAIGTSHGAYKFKIKPDPDKNLLAMDVIRKIHSMVPKLHMVMHGSSSVPQELIAQINKNGGKIAPTFGVPLWAIKEGIAAGVRKVNVDTDLRLASTAAIRKVFYESPEKFDPREYLGPARDAMAALVKERYVAFGSAGHAFDYEPATLEDMKKFY